MARAATPARKTVNTIAAWVVALIIFFPIFWTVMTSFKPEPVAVAFPPVWFDFPWSFENYQTVIQLRGYGQFFWNSVVIAFGSTILGMIIAIPAAWAMAFVHGPRTKDLLMWMLSTKMMPAAGVLVPIYLIGKALGLMQFDRRLHDPLTGPILAFGAAFKSIGSCHNLMIHHISLKLTSRQFLR